MQENFKKGCLVYVYSKERNQENDTHRKIGIYIRFLETIRNPFFTPKNEVEKEFVSFHEIFLPSLKEIQYFLEYDIEVI